MAKILFINLPVKDLERSKHLYEQIGFTVNATFTDNHQRCVMWGEHIYIMLQSHELFQLHIKKRNSRNVPIPNRVVYASNGIVGANE